MGRGIERTKIFREDGDREDFVSRLADLCRQGYLSVYAWALMDTHFHLLVKTGGRSLSQSMRKLLTGYVINFNRRHKRYGHLFQNRYKSIVCEEDPYLLELTRYLHLNPLRGGVVKDLQGLSKYPWTGHSALMGNMKREWQDTETILSYFGRRRGRAVESYEVFVREGISKGRRLELVGGGLIRSLGGWAQVLSSRRRGVEATSDQRVLGSSEFVEGLLLEADEREKETLRLTLKGRKLGSLIAEVGRGEGISEKELRSGKRRREVSRVRRIVCQVAVDKMGYPAAEVARVLGVTTSAVVRAAHSKLMPGIEKYY
jgi:REP element-mobilizing transposase RayT